MTNAADIRLWHTMSFRGADAMIVASDVIVERARRRSMGLESFRDVTPDESQRTLSGTTVSRSMVTEEPDHWCFGAELDVGQSTLWLFVERRESQGLGWAYLASLSRSLCFMRGQRSA